MPSARLGLTADGSTGMCLLPTRPETRPLNAATVIHRRELLRIGGVSVLAAVGGGSAMLAAPASTSGPSASPKAKRCIFMLLQGGPSHLDLWDPKPEAPVEVRGPFQSIDTKLPGVQLRRWRKARGRGRQDRDRAVDDASLYQSHRRHVHHADRFERSARSGSRGQGGGFSWPGCGAQLLEPRAEQSAPQRVAAHVAEHSRPVESHAWPVRRISRRGARSVFDSGRSERQSVSAVGAVAARGLCPRANASPLGFARRAQCRGPAAGSFVDFDERPLAAERVRTLGRSQGGRGAST